MSLVFPRLEAAARSRIAPSHTFATDARRSGWVLAPTKLLAGSLVGVGLLSCGASTASSPARRAPDAEGSTPSREEPAPRTDAPRASTPRAEPSSAGRTLEVDGRTLRLDGALLTPQPDEERFGFGGLNALFRELSPASAEPERCDAAPLTLALAPDARTSDVLGPLGIAAEAGCGTVILRFRSQEIRAGLDDPRSPTPCESGSCYTLTRPEASRVADWFTDALARRAPTGDPAEVLRLTLDRAPRPVLATPSSPTVTPTGNIEPTLITARIYAEYALVHRCLIADAATPAKLQVEFEVGVDGIPHHVQLAPAEPRASATLSSCLAAGFSQMTFPAPNHGKARISYPISRE